MDFKFSKAEIENFMKSSPECLSATADWNDAQADRAQDGLTARTHRDRATWLRNRAVEIESKIHPPKGCKWK